MNKDQAEGKLKDVGGRVERQVGEWAGDEEKQGHGAMKQAEGKVQKAWGDVKEAGKKAMDRADEKTVERETPAVTEVEETDVHTTRRKAS
ncbi:MAG: CsbD family protein [Candidatus Sulfotelmatobacter sp.]